MSTSLQEVRQRIERIQNPQLQSVAKFQLLTACRISEAVGKYAVQLSDLTLTQYKGHDLALWTLHTAKRSGVQRTVALPISQVWVKETVDYFQSRKRRAFDYGISSINHLFAKEFSGLQYLIEKYTLQKGNPIQAHERLVNSHALRHFRLSELVNIYGFDEIDLATFAGWKMKGMASRYVTMAWGRYIDKLLR